MLTCFLNLVRPYLGHLANTQDFCILVRKDKRNMMSSIDNTWVLCLKLKLDCNDYFWTHSIDSWVSGSTLFYLRVKINVTIICESRKYCIALVFSPTHKSYPFPRILPLVCLCLSLWLEDLEKCFSKVNLKFKKIYIIYSITMITFPRCGKFLLCNLCCVLAAGCICLGNCNEKNQACY